jgi:hypothetical protein
VDKVTVVVVPDGQLQGKNFLEEFVNAPVVSKIIVLSYEDHTAFPGKHAKIEVLPAGSAGIINRLLEAADTPYLLILYHPQEIYLGPNCLERFISVAGTVQAGLVYSDYYEIINGERREHPVNDYQPGSIREDFAFGAVMLFSVAAARSACRQAGARASSLPGELYDLRLKVSLDFPLFHLRECLYTVVEQGKGSKNAGHFAYLDPRNHAVQQEMEGLATAHLQRLGAFLEPVFEDVPAPRQIFPVEASVVIPVRDRKRTIADAVKSALSQQTDFSFNVLVIDNHSSDGTTAIISALSEHDERLRHIIPSRRDLNIGGCWNEAAFSAACGRYAIQLDSDDLYSSPQTLQKIVDRLRLDNYALVIGSYLLVDAALETLPPGLIDHREWTETNGRNNALRINGLGAPRAFNTEVLRTIGFLNVGYGEDYAVALRISRQYRIGRIYENLYLCRRWEGNSDAALDFNQQNRYDAFKDNIRTLEIMARREINRERAKAR